MAAEERGVSGGAWRIENSRRIATLVVEPFEPLYSDDREALQEEGERLVRFVAVPQGAQAFEVRFE